MEAQLNSILFSSKFEDFDKNKIPLNCASTIVATTGPVVGPDESENIRMHREYHKTPYRLNFAL